MKARSILAALVAGVLLAAAPGACGKSAGTDADPEEAVSEAQTAEDPTMNDRLDMVREQIRARGVSDPLVLKAMRKVPRHEFVPPEHHRMAYADTPLPIGMEQTISQPYIVAYMTELAGLKGGERVLEVGTGSGYQAAVLAEIAKEVYSIEILCPLEQKAGATLKRLGYRNVTTRCGDGYQGWAEHAPFDVVVVTAAADHIPEPLIRQLRVGGRLVMPVGGSYLQEMMRLTKTASGVHKETLIPVRFVPLTGPLKEAKPPADSTGGRAEEGEAGK